MNSENRVERLQNRISVALLLLYEAESLIKFGALAGDSCITDENLHLKKSFEDHCTLFKNIYKKVEEAVQILNLSEVDK